MFVFFCFCPNPNLPFLKYLSFFVQLLKPHLLFAILFYRFPKPHLFLSYSILPFVQLPLYSVWILFYRSLKPHLFLSKLYSTVCSTPIFFCLHPILPFIEPSSFFVLNLILFYRSLKPHLFLS